MRKKSSLILFIFLIGVFLFIAKHFAVHVDLWTGLSTSVLFAPYWFFGFDLAKQLRGRDVTHPLWPLLLSAAYLIYAVPSHQFRWSIFAGLCGVLLVPALLLDHAHKLYPNAPSWHDAVVLAIFGLAVEFRFFDRAWQVQGLSGLPKLLFLDAALYGYLVLRPFDNIGFDWRPRFVDVRIGLREFLLYTPLALAIGFVLQFLHLHRTLSDPLAFVAGWVFTMFFIAMPEELFFRGLMLNMLERPLGTRKALVVTALIFGLAHFNKRAQYFNWRYVILAAIAGIFYGRAWLANRRLMASSITHATVDTVWSIWLR
jgi:membrane protease YdiL (CAAX protease family)